MSLNLTVYCTHIPDNIVPEIMKRMNSFDMSVEVHPDFAFDEEKDTGFVPFRFQLKDPHQNVLKGKELKSGFELYMDDFDLNKVKEGLKPKLSFFDRLRGRKQEEIAFAPPEIEVRLEACKKAVSFVWHAGDSFELRFASLTSAILTELTNGVCYYPADGIWYDTNTIVAEAFKEVTEYERSLSEDELEFHEFEEW